jgi:hypothetical protein
MVDDLDSHFLDETIDMDTLTDEDGHTVELLMERATKFGKILQVVRGGVVEGFIVPITSDLLPEELKDYKPGTFK